MRRHNIWGKKWISVILCASLIVLSAGCSGSGSAGGSAAGTGETAQGGSADERAAGEGSLSEAEQALLAAGERSCVRPGEKEETVYVKADPYGSPKETTVEVALSKISGADPVEDRSDLSKIKNTEGDEEYVSAGEGRYLWENHGENIRYKGISDRELPVDTKVTYYLEGQEVTAHRIAGETGDVRIRFDYENKTDVPFMVLTAVLLSGDVFSDVEVENGRIIDFGDQKAVIGFAFPGLAASLKLADYEPAEEVELPEYVEITARAEAFELDFTATVVSTGLFDEVKDEDLSDLEDAADDMDELTDASKELKDAAEELADGGGEMGGYLKQYFDGISKLGDGTYALDRGLKALAGNISLITKGSSALQEGLGQVDEALSKIDLSSLSSEESRQAAEAASAALKSLGNNSAALAQKLSSVQEAAKGLAAYNEYLASYGEKVEALRKAIDENPAPVLAETDPELVQKLNEEAAAQANEAVAAQTETLADEAKAAARKAAEEASGAAVGEAMENAAQTTADEARAAVREKVEKSEALDDLGLTGEQIAAAKEQLIAEIQDGIEAETGDIPEISIDPEKVDVSVDPEKVEISLDELLAELMNAMQEEADSRYGSIAAAGEEVETLVLPDMSALSEEEVGGIGTILSEMGASLTVVSNYAQGISSAAEPLGELTLGMERLKDGVKKLSQGSMELNSGLVLFEDALRKTAEGSGALSSAFREVSAAGGELGSAYGILTDGMNEFADGVAKFDEEGIQSLAELAGPEYLEVIRRVRAARDAEHRYDNFSGILDGQKGSVRFMIETEEISAQTDD